MVLRSVSSLGASALPRHSVAIESIHEEPQLVGESLPGVDADADADV
jgi:hypothetical protein